MSVLLLYMEDFSIWSSSFPVLSFGSAGSSLEVDILDQTSSLAPTSDNQQEPLQQSTNNSNLILLSQNEDTVSPASSLIPTTPGSSHTEAEMVPSNNTVGTIGDKLQARIEPEIFDITDMEVIEILQTVGGGTAVETRASAPQGTQGPSSTQLSWDSEDENWLGELYANLDRVRTFTPEPVELTSITTDWGKDRMLEQIDSLIFRAQERKGDSRQIIEGNNTAGTREVEGVKPQQPQPGFQFPTQSTDAEPLDSIRFTGGQDC